MLFLSVERSPEWVIKPGTFAIVDTQMGPMADLQRGLRVRFHAMDSFLETRLLPAKRGRQVARGSLDTEVEATRIGIEEGVLIEFLLSCPEYGTDFVGVNPDGDEPADDDDTYIVPVGAEYLCKLCQKAFAPRGRKGHVNSKLHKANLQARKDAAREGLEDVLDEAGAVENDRLANSMMMTEASGGKNLVPSSR